MRCGIFQQGKDLVLDREFTGVRQLETITGEDLDAIIGPWIMGGGDHDPCVELARTREIGDAGRSDHAGAVDFNTD